LLNLTVQTWAYKTGILRLAVILFHKFE
jgi:hypothetical protein